MVSNGRKKKLVAGAAVAAVASAIFLFSVLRSPPPEPQPVETPPVAPVAAPTEKEESLPPARLQVSDVQGVAERKRSGENKWTPVRSGDELFSDDRIRTTDDAVVHLSLGEESEFELAGRSELGVRELTRTVNALDLALGRLDVSYAEEPDRLLKITASENGEGEGPVAETREGQFTVQRVGDDVTVATRMGKVKLTAMAKSVTIGPGTYSWASADASPRKPEPIPMAVLLKVAIPKQTPLGETRAVVSGKADVGAEVLVNDTPTTVDETGRFRAVVPVRPGRNPVQVVSRTPWGSAEKKGAVTAESGEGEVKDAVVQWGKATDANRKARKKKGAR